MLEQWLKEEICDYLNNAEDEEYCKLTDQQINEIAEHIWCKIADDNEFIDVLYNAICWYANHYIAEHFESEDNNDDK